MPGASLRGESPAITVPAISAASAKTPTERVDFIEYSCIENEACGGSTRHRFLG
jgi:hypothetical protein